MAILGQTARLRFAMDIINAGLRMLTQHFGYDHIRRSGFHTAAGRHCAIKRLFAANNLHLMQRPVFSHHAQRFNRVLDILNGTAKYLSLIHIYMKIGRMYPAF